MDGAGKELRLEYRGAGCVIRRAAGGFEGKYLNFAFDCLLGGLVAYPESLPP